MEPQDSEIVVRSHAFIPSSSGDLHLDRFRLRLLRLGQLHFQYLVFVLRADLATVGILRQCEALYKAPVCPLDTAVFLPFILFPILPIAGDTHDVVLER